ncbi:hypothetical protein R1flu_012646 [Riccia fluitans]|uniref:CCHC-type domain-containing protein n=1 Tax=Riccia fluitans TaxID=41844 RepID=A0ABD1ZB69_9MARC
MGLLINSQLRKKLTWEEAAELLIQRYVRMKGQMKENQVVEQACYMKGNPGKHKHGQSNQKNSTADSSARQHHSKKTYDKRNQCRICFKEGHWANDCPQKTKRIEETNFVEAGHLIHEAYMAQECSSLLSTYHRFWMYISHGQRQNHAHEDRGIEGQSVTGKQH